MPLLRTIWGLCLSLGHGQQEQIFWLFWAFPFPTSCPLYPLPSTWLSHSSLPASNAFPTTKLSINQGIKVTGSGSRDRSSHPSSAIHLRCYLIPLCLSFFTCKMRELNEWLQTFHFWIISAQEARIAVLPTLDVRITQSAVPHLGFACCPAVWTPRPELDLWVL
jgi:hypothetical protein